MKSILFRSFGVSLLLLSLSLFAFADGDMGAGSKKDPGNGGGSAPISTVDENKIDSILDSQSDVSAKDYINWLTEIFMNIGAN